MDENQIPLQKNPIAGPAHSTPEYIVGAAPPIEDQSAAVAQIKGIVNTLPELPPAEVLRQVAQIVSGLM